jgi:hypothetical protein
MTPFLAKKYHIPFICFLLIGSAFAQDFKVIKLKGKAIFYNGSKKVALKKGKTYQGTGIVKTAKRSFARIRIQDAHNITIAPRSSIAIKYEGRTSPPILSLLKGKFRAQIDKKKTNKHKLYVNTRSAVLGVRGTDFILTYNRKNHITSNITLSGEVDFYKKSDSDILDSLKQELDDSAIRSANSQASSTEISDHLAKNEIVKINKGEFSGAYPTYDTPLPPTKISLNQLRGLKKNRRLVKRKKGSRVVYSDSSSSKKYKLTNKNLIPEPKDSDLQGEMTKKEKVAMKGVKVRPGGFIDLNTGIYVMPPKGSKYNAKTRRYEMPSDYGGIDSETGNYAPPKNIFVDPLQGFVRITDGVKHQIDAFSKSVTDLFGKYKNLTRVDLSADARYFYSLKSYESYYGELRNVANAESMIFSFAGEAGRHLYNSKRYLHYIKAGLASTVHNRRDEPRVQRNDRLVSHYGYEFHYRHQVTRRKASLMIDLDFETIYQDYRNTDMFEYYSESSNLSLAEKMKVSRYWETTVGWKLSSYQGYVDANHGNIWKVFWHNNFKTTSPIYFHLNGWYSSRDDKEITDKFKISHVDLGITYENIIRRTNLSIYAMNEWQDSLNNRLIDKGLLDIYRVSALHRVGEFLRIHAFYEYLKNDSKGGIENRDFIQQLWGGGAKFLF